jgi:ABC-2 type transport system permease protein
MQKVWVIIKREYLVRVKTRAFIISTLISPLLLLALILLPGLLIARGGGERNVIVLDQTADSSMFDAVKRNLEQTPKQDNGKRKGPFRGTLFLLTRMPVSPAEEIDTSFITGLAKGDGDRASNKAYVVFGKDLLDRAEVAYYGQSTTDFSLSTLERAISSAVIDARIERAGWDAQKINEFRRDVDLKTNKIGPGGEITQSEGGADFMVAFVMLFFLYMSVLFYGLFVMRGVVEEKQTRIVEVIISSVRPTQMMFGKVIGIGLVGLTQIGVWALSAFFLGSAGVALFASGAAASAIKIPPSLLIYFVVYFVLGYLLFATLYALIGATVSSEDEAQQAQFPVTMLAVIPMMVFTIVMSNPSSTTSIALSLFPFFSPTLMMMRIAVSSPPLWQVLLSMLIMIVSIIGCTWLAAKIYRVGILMYGKRPSIAELGRWLRYN